MLKKLLFMSLFVSSCAIQTEENRDNIAQSSMVRSKCKNFCCIKVTGDQTVSGGLISDQLVVNGKINANQVNITQELIINGQPVSILQNFGAFYFQSGDNNPIAPDDLIQLSGVGPTSHITSQSNGTVWLFSNPGYYNLIFIFDTIEDLAQVTLVVNGSDIASTELIKDFNGQAILSLILQITTPDSTLSLRNTGSSSFSVTQGLLTIYGRFV